MQNQEIVKIIKNLKGRRNYEEKRASKLGFASLYDYFEDKISKKQKAIEEEQKELEAIKVDDQPKATKKNLNANAAKGSLLSTIGLVVINAEDQSRIKIRGYILITFNLIG